MSRCKATTESGERCSRDAEPDSDYCWQHCTNSTQRAGTKFDDIRRRKVLDALRDGATDQTAAAKAGVHRHTLRNWKERHPQFKKRCVEARAEFIMEQLGHIANAAQNDWRAAMELVERLVGSESDGSLAEEIGSFEVSFKGNDDDSDGDQSAAS